MNTKLPPRPSVADQIRDPKVVGHLASGGGDSALPSTTVKQDCPSSASESIIVMGNKVAVADACVVNFVDDRSWDFRRLTHPDPNRQYVYPRKGDKGQAVTDIAGVQGIVDLVVIHSDITYTSRSCFNVLKARGFSTHFMIDWDGTIYQGTDPAQRAIHAASDYLKNVNNRSIGIDMNCVQFNYARGDGDPAPKGAMISQFAQPAGKRRMSETIDINGVPWRSWGYTDVQYDALIKLLQALAREFPNLKLTAPIQETGEVIWGVPGDEAFGEAGKKIGLWGHMHLTARKFDPGPGFDWQRLLQGLTKEHNRFPLELVQGKTIPNLLTEAKVKELANLYVRNNEESEAGGFYPVGLGGQWHGGMHLHAKAGTEVRAMFEGTIVAARNGRQMSSLGSNNFVLIKHEKPFDAEGTKVFTFYSLYMHLEPFDQSLDRHNSPRRDEDPLASPQWVTAAKRIKTGTDEEEAGGLGGEKAEDTDKKGKKDSKRKSGRRKKRKDRGGGEQDRDREDDDEDGEYGSDDGEMLEDEDEEDKYLREQPFLKVGSHLAALERGDVSLFKPDGGDQTRVAAGDVIGRVGTFGDGEMGADGVLHVEILADGSWREVIDLLGVHGAHWIELQADTDDNLSVDTDDLMRLIMPEEVGRKKPKVGDFIFAGKGVAEDDILEFYNRDVGGEGDTKAYVRKAITRHVSEWSDKVNWIKSMVAAQGWDEAVEKLTELLQDKQGKWLRTLFARQIRRQLPFVWLTQPVAEHIGLKDFDGVLYYFHPIHFLMWLTFHTNTRIRVLAKGRSKKELRRLRQKETKLAEKRRLAGVFAEDFDHGSEFESGDFDDVADPREVLQDLWEMPPMQGDWEREEK